MAVVMPVYETGKPVSTKTLYEGAVLMTRERNYHDDSDFYAVVWDAEQKKLTTCEYDSTRYAGGGSAREDATAEVVEAANEYAYQSLKKQAFAAYKEKLAKPVKGDTVTVVKGKNGKGSTGLLFWIGEEQSFNYGKVKVRKVGIALDAEKNEKNQFKNVVWTYFHNIEVTDTAKKFKLSEVKKLLKRLKTAGWPAWSAYQSYPLEYFH